jgi:hypothetical protein
MPAFILAFLARLRFRNLFLVTAAIFMIDVLIPDLIPFIDELLFGALTLLFAAWKRDRQLTSNSPPPPLPNAPDR